METQSVPAAIFPNADAWPFGAAVVIGGAGFIGSRLVADLRSRDIPVVVLDDFSRPNPAGLVGTPKGLVILHGDTRDRDAVKVAIREAAMLAMNRMHDANIAVFLLAAHTANGDLSPHQYRLNACGPLVVAGALGMLRSEKPNICTTLTFASSFAIYGDVPWNDSRVERAEHHVRPLTDYGRSKRDAECAIKVACAHAENPNFVSLRFSNVIGASERVGEITTADPVGGLAAAMIYRPEVEVLSYPRATKDGATWRNFIDVRDVSAALMHAAIYAAEPLGQNVFNVCGDKPCPIVNLVAAANVPFTQPELSPLRGDVAYSHGDNERFKKVCAPGWRPMFTLQDSADMIATRRAIVQSR